MVKSDQRLLLSGAVSPDKEEICLNKPFFTSILKN